MNRRASWTLLIIIVFLAGAAGSYIFMKYYNPDSRQPVQPGLQTPSSDSQDLMVLRIFLPGNSRLEAVERKLQKRTRNLAIAEAVVEEFFRNAGNGSAVPPGVKLLGIYRDSVQMLYIDLSDELRRNFQGDALSEYLLLKGMYDSLVANVQDFQDVKVLVEGKEIETLGGHFYLKYPLKSIVLTELKTESKTTE